jgi:hypothetical protein
MAKKIFTVSIVLALALAGMAFASGQKEPGATVPGQSGRAGPGVSGEKIVVTGNVSINNLIHPTIKSGDKVYELMVPRTLVYRSGIKEGAKVTVEGYTVQGMPMWRQTDDGSIDLFVTKATFDGKDYDLSQYRGRFAGGYRDGDRGGYCGGFRGRGMGGRGFRGPMMGGGWDSGDDN